MAIKDPGSKKVEITRNQLEVLQMLANNIEAGEGKEINPLSGKTNNRTIWEVIQAICQENL